MLAVTDTLTTPPGNWSIRNPEDGIRITMGLANHLWGAWRAHRRAKEQPDLSQAEMEDIFCRQLPSGCLTCGLPPVNLFIYPELVEINKLDSADKTTWGNAMWSVLHTHKITGDSEREWQWLRAFSMAIPCKISCKPHFDAYMADFPPDFTSQETFLHWTYSCHQSVNARRGMQGITWEECKSRYLV